MNEIMAFTILIAGIFKILELIVWASGKLVYFVVDRYIKNATQYDKSIIRLELHIALSILLGALFGILLIKSM